MTFNVIKIKIKNKLRVLKNYFNHQVIERYALGKLREDLANASRKSNDNKSISMHIVFNTQYAWTYIWIEYLLAHQLKLRGHQVSMLVCDGVSYCEQETVTTRRPDCSTCFKRTKRHLHAFGHEYTALSQLIGDVDKAEAIKLSLNLSLIELRRFTLGEIEVGQIAYQNLIHFFKGIFPLKGKVETKYRQIFEAAYLVAMATLKYFEMNKAVDVVVSANGKFIQSGIGVDYAKMNSIDYVTWEVFNQFSGCIFGRNNIALEQRLDDVWEAEKDKPLTKDQKRKLYKNFELQAKSENTPFKYHESYSLQSREGIIKRFKLDISKPIIVMFPNVEWDSTAMMGSGFESMLDWLLASIDYARVNSEYQLIIRAHPGELKVPHDLKTNTPICDRIKAIYSELPGNIHLIDPLEDISSYALADLSDAIMVYTSTMGLEFALKGRKAWVAAYTYYYNKGFTIDLKSKADMYARLDQKQFDDKLDEREHMYAERFAYMVRYRRLFSFPYFKNGKFKINEYRKNINSKHPVISNICDMIEGERSCLDLGEANW